MAYDDTTMFAVTNTQVSPGVFESILWELNPVTGVKTIIGSMGIDAGTMIGIACDSAGNIYGYDITNDNFHSIDKITGDATVIGSLGFDFNGAQDMSFNKETNSCFIAGYVNSTGGLYKVDVATGGAFFMGEFQYGMEITAFAIPDGDDLLPPENLEAYTEGNSVFLSWDAPSSWAIDGYNIYREGQITGFTTETSWADLCVLPGEYVYTITTVFNVAESDHSNPADATIMNCFTLLREEGFEEYTIGQQLVLQAENMGIDYWHCWSTPAGSDEDPFVSNEQIFEGNNSIIIEELNDAYMDLEGKTEGKYSVNFKLYVPSGFDGFFGIWRELSSWSAGMEAYFYDDETGIAIVANSDWQTFTYSADTWNNVQAVFDLDNDWAKLYINGTMICQAQWSLGQYGEPGPLKLDIIDFWAGGSPPKSFVDNIEFLKIVDDALPPENLEVSVNENNVTLTWDAPMEGIIEYLIFRDGDQIGSTTALNYPDEGLEPGDYEYEVIAIYGDCESLPAGPVTATAHPFQIITINQGWSGISSYLNPIDPDVVNIFAPVIDNLVILQNETGMYWPGENVNTLGNWNSHEGYKIKVTENVEVTVWGPNEPDRTIMLNANWNLIPVLSSCVVNVEELFLGTDVLLVKEVAGCNIYWPGFSINTLGFLQAGMSYFVLMNNTGSIQFPECTKSSYSVFNVAKYNSVCPEIWNNVQVSPNSHLIYIPENVFINGGFRTGDILGCFNSGGICAGTCSLGLEHYLAVFPDDPTTPEVDGLLENEPITFKIWRQDELIELKAEATFNQNLPQHDGLFTANGISAFTGLKTGASGIEESQILQVSIYPNPVRNFVNIHIENSSLKQVNAQIFGVKGELMQQAELFPGINRINISGLTKGVYLLKISDDGSLITKRLVKK